MSRVVHFEVPTNDVETSKEFYANVFGWKFTKWEGPEVYWLISTGDKATPGIDGGFYEPQGGLSGTVNTIGVGNIDETLAKLQECGGQVIVPKMEVPGVGVLAYAKDPQGAVFGVLQPDPSSMM